MAVDHHKDAYYACKLSLAYLKIHGWWDSAKTRFPAFLRSWVDTFFICRYENASHVPPGWWSSRRTDRLKGQSQASLFDKAMDFFDLDALSDRIQDFTESYTSEDAGDLLETVFLATLIIAFVAVYRRRRRNRGRQQVADAQLGAGARRGVAFREIAMPKIHRQQRRFHQLTRHRTAQRKERRTIHPRETMDDVRVHLCAACRMSQSETCAMQVRG